MISRALAQVSRAWVAWYEGDLPEALTHASEVEATLDRIPLRSQEPGSPLDSGATNAARPRLIFLYLTLGRLKAAQAVAERSHMLDTRVPFMLAYVLLERGDLDGLRAYLTNGWTHGHPSPRTASGGRVEFLVPAGMLDEAARDIERFRQHTPPAARASTAYSFAVAQLETAYGRPRQVVRHLEPWLAAPRRVMAPMNFQAEFQRLAEAWTDLGQPAKAIELLERATAQLPTFEAPAQHHLALQTHAQLARLYRQHGQVAEARVVEDRLRRLLAVADPDHPLVLELKSRE